MTEKIIVKKIVIKKNSYSGLIIALVTGAVRNKIMKRETRAWDSFIAVLFHRDQ
jgi:hypothetical protein